MAGFFNNNRGFFSNRNNPIAKINSNYDGLLIKNSQTIGYIEGELKRRSIGGTKEDALFDAAIALADTTSRYRSKVPSFFQLDYAVKVEKLRDMAANGEIEYVLDNIADDVIVYDEHNRFCYPADIRKVLQKRKGINSERDNFINEEQLMAEYMDTFDDIYAAWGFDNGIYAWQLLYQYLIEGRLSFEIIFDNPDNPKKIIGFKRVDSTTLFPVVEYTEKGEAFMSWLQRDPSTNTTTSVSDNQIIYLQYSAHHQTKHISFVERMVRSFNTLRIVEYSKVMWHLMYGAIRLNTKVPTGTKGWHKAQESVEQFKNAFKEDINFNMDTGELLVDGQPKLHYYKNYITPVDDSGKGVEIESINFDTPDLQDNQLLLYFFKKLKLDSKLPFSRWDYDEGGGSYLQSPDSMTNEVVEYEKFISRLRTGFAELITKPVYIQMCLNNKIWCDNARLRNSIGVKFNDDKLLQRMKQAEINTKNAETIQKLMELKLGGGDDAEAIFDPEFLVKKYFDMSEEDFAENEKYKRLAKIKKDKFAAENGWDSDDESTDDTTENGGDEEMDNGEGGDMGGSDTDSQLDAALDTM